MIGKVFVWLLHLRLIGTGWVGDGIGFSLGGWVIEDGMGGILW
jgi:hypothetical protein